MRVSLARARSLFRPLLPSALSTQARETTAHRVIFDSPMAGFLLFIFKTSFFRKLQKNNNGADLRE